MKNNYLGLNWAFGILFLVLGLFCLIKSICAGLSLIIVSLILLPPVRRFVYLKMNEKMSTLVRIIYVIALIIVSAVCLSKEESPKKQAVIINNVSQDKADLFKKNRDQIVASVKNSLQEKDYKLATSQSAAYLTSGDEEIKEMYTTAKNKLDEIKKRDREEKKQKLDSRSLSCKIELIKISPPSKYSSVNWFWYIAKGDECRAREILDIKLKDPISKHCPQCSIYVFDNLDALEWDYKIMNWGELGISNYDYSNLRNDKKMVALYKKHFLVEYEDSIYPNSSHRNYGLSEMYPGE